MTLVWLPQLCRTVLQNLPWAGQTVMLTVMLPLLLLLLYGDFPLRGPPWAA